MVPSREVPVVDFDTSLLEENPYPTYAQLRREAPIAFVPQLNSYAITRLEDVRAVLRDTERFSSSRADLPGDKVIGTTLMTKNGEDHRNERKALDAPLKPRASQQQWQSVFAANAEARLDSLADRGEADLLAEFARPLVGDNLVAVLGFDDVSAEDLVSWTEAFIAAAGNFLDDQAVWATGFAAREAFVAATDAAIARVRDTPDGSVISSMVHAENPMSRESMYSNLMISVGGGLNEPSHALTTAAYALLVDSQERQIVTADPQLWRNVFEEAVRWVAPIQMAGRQVSQRVEIAGVELQPGDNIGVFIASANRDERMFAQPEHFDVRRPDLHHVAFGGGPHFCAGAHISRAMVALVALPALFERFKGLRLDPDYEVTWSGFLFRGLDALRVRWDT